MSLLFGLFASGEITLASLIQRVTDLENRVTSLETRVTDQEEFQGELDARLTTAENAVTALEVRVTALEEGQEPPAPALVETGPSYWMPTSQFSFAHAQGVTAAHHWVGTPTGPLTEAQNLGLKVDVELGAHAGANGTATPALVTSRLTALKNAGFTDTIRIVWLIDEPDIHPAGTWNMQLMRDLYSAAKAVHPWPVGVLVRAHSSTYDRAVPFFANDVSDLIGWDPYLAAWVPGPGLGWIEAEAARLRGDLGTKPLIGIMQAGFVGWSQDATHPAKRPSITELRDMGFAALQGGATGIGLWFENDWPLQPIAPWTQIGQAVTAWEEWVPPMGMLSSLKSTVSVDDVPLASVRPLGLLVNP